VYPVLNVLGRNSLGQQAATYGCPWTPPNKAQGGEGAYAVTTDPTLNCMRDARGNTVCSDGSHFPPGCPHTPPPEFFSPGVTPDITNAQGMIEGQIPAPRGAGSAPAAAPAAAPTAAASTPTGGPSPLLLVGGGALGTAALATAAYFLFFKK
jgi:hypothetical protein